MSPTTENAQAKLQQASQQFVNHPAVQQGAEVVNRQMNILDRELAKYGFLNDLESKTNIPKTYGVLGMSVTFLFLIFLNVFGLASPVTNLIGWALPAYLSCSALESPSAGDDKQWLTYWIVFGFFNFIESAMLRLVLYYIPYYFTIKLAFTIWLMLPATRGAETLYHSALRPFFRASRSSIQNATAPRAHTKTPSTSTSTNIPSISSQTGGYSTAGYSAPTSTLGSSTGYSTATNTNNPFATPNATHIGEVPIPVAAGVPLPPTQY